MARAARVDGRVLRCAPLACALIALSAWPFSASAQPAPTPAAQPSQTASPDRQALAEAAFAEAMDAWRRSDWTAAVEGFSRAMELVPHPFTRYNLARALEHAGEVSRAITEYERFLAETTDPDDRREVEGRIATLRARPVEVIVASEPLDASVTVDAEAHPTAQTPCHIRLAPGAHVIVVEHPGYERAVRRIVVEAGTPQDVLIQLEARAAPVVTPPATPPDRVNTRRTARMFSGRAGLITGFSVPRDRPVFAVGVEGGVFYRRSLAAQAHAMWIDTDGAPVLVGADLGWVFVLDEVDLGLFVTGSALFQCDTSCRESTLRRDSEQFVGGFSVRADVVLHPRIGVGLFGRAAWRNFDLTNSEGLLASGGLSLSLFL